MNEPPFGILGPEPFVVQGTDEHYSEQFGKWVAVDASQIGKWSDDCFPSHTSFRGYLWRLSDAVHEDRFKSVYGRPKPPRMHH